MRKTIAVEKLKDDINLQIRFLENDIESKKTLCTVIEKILMDTGNYRGFRWLMSSERAKEVQPGDSDYYDRLYF